MDLDRRAFTGGLAAAAGFGPAALAMQAEGGDPFDGAALHRDVVTYATFGRHLAGSAADLATLDWVETRFRAAGLDVVREPGVVRQYSPQRAQLRLYGQPFAGVPLWFSPSVEAATGRLVSGASPEAAGNIAVFDVTDFDDVRAMPARVAEAAEAGAAAAVFITRTVSGGAYHHNTYRVPQVPTLVLGSAHIGAVEAARSAGAPAEVHIAAEVIDEAPTALLHARSGGTTEPRVAISTPLSAFTRAAGERGPGVALLLALAEEAARTGLPAVFVAGSGHELGEPLLLRHLASPSAPPTSTAWLHIGAGLATFRAEGGDGQFSMTSNVSEETRLFTTEPGLVDSLRVAFAGLPWTPRAQARAIGAARAMIEAGYRTVALEGGSAFHHVDEDLPYVTGPEPLARTAQALAETMHGLAGGWR